MTDVKYDAELCERLEREARAQYALVEHQGFGCQAGTMITMADQLAAARAEIARLEAMVSVSPDDIRNVVVENDRMHEAFDQAMKKLRAGSTLVKSAMCTWCGQHWPMLEGETFETSREYTNKHAESCPANDIRIERDKLRAEIERLVAAQPNWSHAEALQQRDAIVAASIDAHRRIREIAAERDAMRPVVEAAERYRDDGPACAGIHPAVDAYRAARDKAGGS